MAYVICKCCKELMWASKKNTDYCPLCHRDYSRVNREWSKEQYEMEREEARWEES